jgi:hypothetical protein
MQFGRRGKEGLKELKQDSIVIKKDGKGREYATIAYNELDKTHQINNPKESEKKQILYSQDNPDLCPIESLKKYKSKLNGKCPSFFQRPRQLGLLDPEKESVWYENKCLGIHKIESMMKAISQEAELSQIYTNHCLRATTSTILAHAGVDTRNICSVTGHKNHQSLESYIREPTLNQRKEMCDILHNFGKDAYESKAVAIPETRKSTTTCTISKPTDIPAEYTVAIPKPVNKTTCTVSKPTDTASDSSLFSGAQFLGSTTINVMINQNNQ